METDNKRSWTTRDVDDYSALPPDLTLAGATHIALADMCADEMDDYVCTRRPGHTGRHAGGDSNYIVAVWGDGH